MKNLIFTIFSICSSILANAQPTLSIEVYNNTDPSSLTFSNPQVISIEKNGFVLNENKNNESNISFYNVQGEHLWSAKASKEYSRKNITYYGGLSPYDMRSNFMVASNSGLWVYNVELNTVINKKNNYVTQIDKKGTVKKFTITGSDEFGKELQSVFCDDQHFYLLTTLQGNEMSKNKKSDEKLILNRFDATDFTYNKFILDLPTCNGDDYTTFWTFLGQSATEKFLVTKNVNTEANKIVLTIAAFDTEGRITRTFSIEPTIDGKFFRPSHGVKSPVSNFHQRAEFDYYLKPVRGSSYMTVDCGYGGFSHLIFNPLTESFFVFGLSGPKTFTKIASIYDSFYIIKYDLNGKSQWTLQQPASTGLMSENYFRVHALPGYRDIFLKVLPDMNLYFSIHFKRTLYTYQISSEGKTLITSKKQDMQELTDAYEFSLKN